MKQKIYLLLKRSEPYLILGVGESKQPDNLKLSHITLEKSAEILINNQLPSLFFNSKTLTKLYQQHSPSLQPPQKQIRKKDIVNQFTIDLPETQ